MIDTITQKGNRTFSVMHILLANKWLAFENGKFHRWWQIEQQAHIYLFSFSFFNYKSTAAAQSFKASQLSSCNILHMRISPYLHFFCISKQPYVVHYLANSNTVQHIGLLTL